MRTRTQLKRFFAQVLIALTALTALGQKTGLGQSFGKPAGTSVLPHATAGAQAKDRPSGGNVTRRRPQGKGLATATPSLGVPVFLPVVTYDPAGQSLSVAVADVNGDGKPDLLVANACIAVAGSDHNSDCAEGSIGVLLGKGDGTFRPVVTYKSGGSIPSSVAVADVDGDGKLDLLVANCGPIGINVCNHANGLMGVLLGNGDGTFRAVLTYDSGGSTVVAVAVADVNGDGKPDLLVANECGTSTDCGRGSVGVLLGNGDGTFQAAKNYDVGYAINSLAVADVNGDGRLDLLVAKGGTNNNVGVLLGNGNGTFQPVLDYDSGGNTALSVVVADVNGDGKPDLLVANQDSEWVCSWATATAPSIRL